MKNILIIFLLIVTIPSSSQNNNTQAALYNIGLGGITSSIGAALNKKPSEKLGKVMLKGFWQGALGGSFVYGSKALTYEFHKNTDLEKLWMAKIVNSVGISMIENASLNKEFYDKWHIHIGFNRIELDVKNNFKMHYKILPASLISFIVSTNYGKFNLKYSANTLTPIFIGNNDREYAITITNSILISDYNIHKSLTHEIIHTFQYDDYMSINVFFNKRKGRWKANSKFINKFSKPLFVDVPGALSLRSLYVLENLNQKCYFDNYFEHEANFYSNKNSCN